LLNELRTACFHVSKDVVGDNAMDREEIKRRVVDGVRRVILRGDPVDFAFKDLFEESRVFEGVLDFEFDDIDIFLAVEDEFQIAAFSDNEWNTVQTGDDLIDLILAKLQP